MVRTWAEKTPDDFRMSAKFPRSVCHAGDGPRPDAGRLLVPETVWGEAERFLEVMGELGDRCGPLVLQFPYFNKAAFPDRGPFLDRLEAFLERLPDGFRYGVELRNRAWVDDTLGALLRRHATALVLVDLAYMPHPADLAQRMDVITADFCYARLIGDRKAVEAKTKRFDKLVLDQGQRLARWAGLLETIRERVTRTYLYANNHYAGHAPATIAQLQALLGEVGGG
jgi:uncharacterized protein YecE (DUF72 family)